MVHSLTFHDVCAGYLDFDGVGAALDTLETDLSALVEAVGWLNAFPSEFLVALCTHHDASLTTRGTRQLCVSQLHTIGVWHMYSSHASLEP